jgi:5'-nucleotidase
MKRREFLTATMGAGALMALAPGQLLAKPASALRLTIVHSNDVHSWLEPMDSGEFAGLGGAPARAAYVRAIRDRHPHVLVLDVGDMFQGTPYFNLFQGEPEILAMNSIGYDAGTVGNHDFDAGIDRLAELLQTKAEFPLLNCNYDFADTPLNGLTKEYMVKEFDGARVGLLGLGIALDGLVKPELCTGTVYREPIADARRVARHLREEERCDFIVALSHINILNHDDPKSKKDEPGDRDLIMEVPEIDVILSGHNHILLPKAEKHERRDALPGYINQAGWAGTHMGLLHFDLYDRRKQSLALGGSSSVSM